MENPDKGNFNLVKKSFLYVVFIIELIFLFKVSFDFVESEKYFSLSKNFAVPYVLILILSLLTVSLISLTIEKKWEILLSPALIFISSFIFLKTSKGIEALLGLILFSLYFLYEQERSDFLTKGFLKINTRHSARPVTKGFLLTISAIISLAVYLNSQNLQSLDVGKLAANIAEKPIEDAVKKEYEKETPEDINAVSLQSLKESNPQIFSVLNSFGINELPINIPTSESISENISGTITGTVKKSISDQVNKTVEPYRKFFKPTLALLVFGILQIYSSIAYFVFSSFSGIFLLLLRKTRFINIQKVPAEKEIINF